MALEPAELRCNRLTNHQIILKKFKQPVEAVGWMGAIQAQDNNGAKWAIGLRCQGTDVASIEQAISDKTILRTWLNRGTLHMAAAEDVRWMLSLFAGRVIASSEWRYRQLDLDRATFSQSWEVWTRALKDGQRLTRKEALLALEQAGISTAGQRGYYMLGRAALEGLICFGPQHGKQQTFVLLDEWTPIRKTLVREEALAELAMRYFQSHGPATLQDFTWWSGLLVADARAALQMASPYLEREKIADLSYWQPRNEFDYAVPSITVCLLPAFDEFYLGYSDRKAVLDPRFDRTVISQNGIFRPVIVLDGQVAGIWKQEIKKGRLKLKLSAFEPLSEIALRALLSASEAYAAFLGLPLEGIDHA